MKLLTKQNKHGFVSFIADVPWSFNYDLESSGVSKRDSLIGLKSAMHNNITMLQNMSKLVDAELLRDENPCN